LPGDVLGTKNVKRNSSQKANRDWETERLTKLMTRKLADLRTGRIGDEKQLRTINRDDIFYEDNEGGKGAES
jgi:hypothetical protein